MGFVILNSPSDVSWYSIVFDAMVLAFLATAVSAAVRGWRRGRRDYALLLIVAPFYGMSLEISGMLTHKSYLQGDFLVMFNFTQWEAFHGSTNVPLYVPLFYPAFLFFGYKLAETMGIRSNWRRAVAGGAFMGLLDVCYIIQGGLRHVVWWTWRPWEMYQLWQGWPGIDLWWEMTWGALLFWMVLTVTPRVNRWFDDEPLRTRANRLKAFVAVPAGLVIALNVVGPVLMIPAATIAKAGGEYWPATAVLASGFAAVLLLSPKQPIRRVDRTVATLAAIYGTAFVPMIVGNIIQDGQVRSGARPLDPMPDPRVYVPLQIAALVGILAATTYPRWARRSDRNSGCVGVPTLRSTPAAEAARGVVTNGTEEQCEPDAATVDS